jgi:hypothetical protein
MRPLEYVIRLKSDSGRVETLITNAFLFVIVLTCLVMLFPFTLSPLEKLESWADQVSLTPVSTTLRLSGLALVLVLLACRSRTLKVHATMFNASVLGMLAFILLTARYEDGIIAAFPWILVLTAGGLKMEEKSLCWKLMVIGLGCNMVMSIWAYTTSYHQLISSSIGERACGLFGTPITLYTVSIISIFAFLSMITNSKIFISLSMASFSVLILTFSRAGWIGFAVALIYLSTKLVHFKHRCIGSFFAILLISLALTIRTGGSIVKSTCCSVGF